MNINGEVTEGSMEIDSDNNLERFKTGSAAEEAVEIHDFQIVSDFFVLVLSSCWEVFVCLEKNKTKQSCQCKHGMSVILCRE